MPVFLIVEDVGWWQGADGSAVQQPYRNAFPRRHCLADYQALVRLARRLGTCIAVGMVLGEWDRSNVLRDVPGATWMGDGWDNQDNQGPWLDEVAGYLCDNQDSLELGLHGLCHEFWNDGKMERSEFHDGEGVMRPAPVIKAHLEAFARIFADNGLSGTPRLFLPPALNHSFGNGKESIQAILHEYGIRHVITRFARARHFAPPYHEFMTWECGVGLLERGLSPVSWHVPASSPVWDFSGPILPLHWGNLLHPDPGQNDAVIDGWAEMLLAGTAGPHFMLAKTFIDCWRQAAVFYFGQLSADDWSITLNLQALPKDIPYDDGGDRSAFQLKIRTPHTVPLRVEGAQVLTEQTDGEICTLQIIPRPGTEKIKLLPA